MIKKSSFYEVHAYMARSLKDAPLATDNIRIAVYQNDIFTQYLDVSSDIPDTEITEICVEMFGVEVEWEHFSCPERFDGPPNRTPPAPDHACYFYP